MTRLDAAFLHDPALVAVLKALMVEGNRALMVGGCVRNALLQEPVADIDIATDAPPEETQRLAEQAGLRTIPTGLEHGTITILSDGTAFEVTTFRRDEQTDGRHAVVAFSDRLEDDAQRRDFTMNALYADRDGNVIDPVGGLDDLRERRLRFVGLPDDRIQEDYLRILRFFRFLAWYGRQAEPAALEACARHVPGLDRISRERIGSEMRKLLAAPDPGPAIALMAETNVLSQVLSDARPDALIRLVSVEGSVPPDWQRRLAALGGTDVATALRLSRTEERTQQTFSKALAQSWSPSEAGYRLGETMGCDHALLMAARGATLPDGWRDRVADAASAPLPISAHDLMPALSGPALGIGLAAAERAWIDGHFTVPAPALIDTALLAGSEEK